MAMVLRSVARATHEPLMWSHSCSPLYQGPGHSAVFWICTSMSAETPAFLASRAKAKSSANVENR